MLVAGITVLPVSLLLLASRLWQASCFCKFLMVPVAGLSAITDFTGVANGVVGVSTVSFEHAVAGGPAVNVLPAVEAFLLLVVSLLILMSLF